MVIRARQYQFEFPGRPLVAGILNVTPDSFFDGGRYLDPARAVERGLELAEQGADLIDVGGESTRPGAQPVDETAELKRVIPVVQELAGRLRVPLSIDTSKPAVARQALLAGASVINDIGAGNQSPEMWELAGHYHAGYVCMHMQGSPQTMQVNPIYHDVVAEVAGFFADRLARLRAAGMHPDQIILDPGIGFGKKLEHNLAILRGLDRFMHHGRPILLGISRKSFLGKLLGEESADRLSAGLACTCWARLRGANLFRTHDVVETRHALHILEHLASQADP